MYFITALIRLSPHTCADVSKDISQHIVCAMIGNMTGSSERETDIQSVVHIAYQQKTDEKKGRLREGHKRRGNVAWNGDKEEDYAAYAEETDSEIETDYREKLLK